MLSLRVIANKLLALFAIVSLAAAHHLFAQGALLLEQPYGFFGTINPTGHAAVYLERVCADTPVHLRLCGPAETGVVISRYKGLNGYDWVAVPLIPYLYSVDDPAQVPAVVDRETVNDLRLRYKETHLSQWDDNLPKGNIINGGWTQLVGTAYDRRTYAFRFATTVEQDEQLIAFLNDHPNHSHFNLFFNNCADFDRSIMNNYFPHTFRRTIFPDAGMTTPKRIANDLVRNAKRDPEVQLAVVEIPQVPGFRHKSGPIHGVTESILANGYVIPIVVLHPYVAGVLVADYLVRGRYSPVPKHTQIVDATSPEELIHMRPGRVTATPAPGLTAVPAAEPAAPEPGLSLTDPVPASDNPIDFTPAKFVSIKDRPGHQSAFE